MNIKIDFIRKKQEIMGYRDIKFSNIFRDPSAIREVLAYKIAGKYLHSPKASFANVYINDTLYGLYTMVEDVDKAFAKKHFGSNKGVFFKCENTTHTIPEGCSTIVADGLTIGFTLDSTCYKNQYELKSKYGWKELLELMMAIWYNNDSTSKYFNKIENYLDVEEILRMLAFNNLFVNLDSYSWSGRNYFLYKGKDSLFHPIMWDFNQCFGGFSHFYPYQKLSEVPIFANIHNIYRPLISKLLRDSIYRKKYLTFYSELIRNEILNGNFENEAKKLHTLVLPYIKSDPFFYYKFDGFSESLGKTIDNEIPGIIELMKKRVAFLKIQNELNDILAE